MVMLGQSALCACFGFAYIGILNLPPMIGVALPTMFLPLPIWGVIWFLCASHLATAAFKVDQSKALGWITALLMLWAFSYLYYFITTPTLPSGYTNGAFLSSAMLGSMLLNAVGISRMLNVSPSHTEAIEMPGTNDVE
jgi:DMSO reductase anchor subunit